MAMSTAAGLARRVAAGFALATAVAATPAGGEEIRISIDGGRVTLVATEARLADVLAEWSRVGATRFEGVEALAGEPVTLHLADVTEEAAISLLLDSATGYVAAPRRGGSSGPSRYDRVTILVARDGPAPGRGRAAASVTGRGDDIGAGTAPRARVEAAAPTLVAMEELQRLMDATARAAAGPTDRGPVARDVAVAVATTPLPGVGAVLRSMPAGPPRGRGRP